MKFKDILSKFSESFLSTKFFAMIIGNGMILLVTYLLCKYAIQFEAKWVYIAILINTFQYTSLNVLQKFILGLNSPDGFLKIGSGWLNKLPFPAGPHKPETKPEVHGGEDA